MRYHKIKFCDFFCTVLTSVSLLIIDTYIICLNVEIILIVLSTVNKKLLIVTKRRGKKYGNRCNTIKALIIKKNVALFNLSVLFILFLLWFSIK